MDITTIYFYNFQGTGIQINKEKPIWDRTSYVLGTIMWSKLDFSFLQGAANEFYSVHSQVKYPGKFNTRNKTTKLLASTINHLLCKTRGLFPQPVHRLAGEKTGYPNLLLAANCHVPNLAVDMLSRCIYLYAALFPSQLDHSKNLGLGENCCQQPLKHCLAISRCVGLKSNTEVDFVSYLLLECPLVTIYLLD